MNDNPSQKIAGPKGSFLLGNLAAFGRDPLQFLENCASHYGDYVLLRFGNRPVLLINNPADIEFVLQLFGGNVVQG